MVVHEVVHQEAALLPEPRQPERADDKSQQAVSGDDEPHTAQRQGQHAKRDPQPAQQEGVLRLEQPLLLILRGKRQELTLECVPPRLRLVEVIDTNRLPALEYLLGMVCNKLCGGVSANKL
eukprot:6142828-Pleurochrysis_carterae.AAC.3